MASYPFERQAAGVSHEFCSYMSSYCRLSMQSFNHLVGGYQGHFLGLGSQQATLKKRGKESLWKRRDFLLVLKMKDSPSSHLSAEWKGTLHASYPLGPRHPHIHKPTPGISNFLTPFLKKRNAKSSLECWENAFSAFLMVAGTWEETLPNLVPFFFMMALWTWPRKLQKTVLLEVGSRSLVKEDWKSVQGDKQFNRYSMGWVGRQKEMARASWQ